MYRAINIPLVFAFALGVALTLSGLAFGDADLSLSLDRITNNSTTGDAIGDQISIGVSDTSTGLEFLVSNLGTEESIVVRFYWRDAPNYIDFSTFVVPSGWEAVIIDDFVGARTMIPRAENGLGPGESALFNIDYASGANFASFTNALLTGELEFRLHIRDIEGNFRETFRTVVNQDSVVAPLPAPFALSLVGMGCIAVARRRSRSRNKTVGR